MQEQLISFKTAKLAKEKGFNIPCMYGTTELNFPECSLEYYGENANETTDNTGILHVLVLTPTQSLLQKWLREVHNIQVIVIAFASDSMNENSNTIYCFFTNNKHFYGFVNKDHENEYNTYEEALEEGLIKALRLIKKIK